MDVFWKILELEIHTCIEDHMFPYITDTFDVAILNISFFIVEQLQFWRSLNRPIFTMML